MVRAAFLIFLFTALAAQAAPLGKTPLQDASSPYGVALPAPNGYCELTRTHPADREMLALTEQMNAGHNRVLGVFTDCSQLASMRGKGAVLTDHAIYLSPVSADGLPPTMKRSEFLNLVAGELENTDAFERAEDIVRDRLSEADAAINLQDLVNLGPLYRDDSALYTGVLTRTDQGGAGVEVTAVIIGLTLVSGHVVSLNLSAPYEGQPTIDRLLADQRRNIDRLIAAN